MKKNTTLLLFLSVFIISSAFLINPAAEGEAEKINWMTFQQALELSKKEKKKIFIDFYTDWCGWCKVMDKNTFSHKSIAQYMNKNYYAVKFNAEMRDTIVFNNTTFVNPSPSTRSTHQLASTLLNNQLSYPSTVYLDENFNLLTVVPGYLQPNQMEPIMKFFGENVYSTTKWEDYQKTFKSEIEPVSNPTNPH